MSNYYFSQAFVFLVDGDKLTKNVGTYFQNKTTHNTRNDRGAFNVNL